VLLALTASANKCFALADLIRRTWGIPTLAGGTFATYMPDLCLEHFDYVIRHEGDEAVVQLLDCLQRGADPGQIAGLSYRSPSGAAVHNPHAEGLKRFDTVQNLSLIEGYDKRSQWWHILTQRKIRWIVLQASRGCPFTCDYCIAPVMYGPGYRPRGWTRWWPTSRTSSSTAGTSCSWTTAFTGNRRYVKDLLRRMIERKLRGTFLAFVRHETAADGELLDLLREVGFAQLYIGAESVNDDVFVRMNKRQTIDKLVHSIQSIQEHGMDVTLSFQAGNDEDDRYAVKRAVDFGLEHDISGVYFISTWSWPESPSAVFDQAADDHQEPRLLHGALRDHFPLRMKPSTLQRAILEQQRRFWSPSRLPGMLRRGQLDRASSLLIQRYALSLFDGPTEQYVSYLEEIEQGYYDEDERLDLEKIATRQ